MSLGRIAVFAYGVVCYVIFLGTVVYAIGFLGDVGVPKSIDSGGEVPLGEALFVNLALVGVFAVQHSLMARQRFKLALTKLIPQPAERSTYVLLSSLALLLLFWQWRPMGGTVWEIENAAGRGLLQTLFATGWLIVVSTTVLINHFDLFGLRQVYLHLRGLEYRPLAFKTPGLYQHVRHPIYLGWLLAFWCTPTMTAAHLVFAAATTAYILAAIRLEERDLVRFHGDAYRNYQKSVPMIIPSVNATNLENGGEITRGDLSDEISAPRAKAKAAGTH